MNKEVKELIRESFCNELVFPSGSYERLNAKQRYDLIDCIIKTKIYANTKDNIYHELNHVFCTFLKGANKYY